MKEFKLGFIVEGDADEIIVNTLVHRLLPPTVHSYTVPLGSKGQFHSAYITVIKFLEKAYKHVVVLFNADTTDAYDITLRQQRYAKQFREYALEKHVTLVPAVPQIEAWLLANYREQPEQCHHPEEDLAAAIGVQKLTVPVVKEIAEKADIGLIKDRSPSFKAFVGVLKTVTKYDERTTEEGVKS